jgi:hypothetical protein
MTVRDYPQKTVIFWGELSQLCWFGFDRADRHVFRRHPTIPQHDRVGFVGGDALDHATPSGQLAWALACDELYLVPSPNLGGILWTARHKLACRQSAGPSSSTVQQGGEPYVTRRDYHTDAGCNSNSTTITAVPQRVNGRAFGSISVPRDRA